jgi:hypothetical protein
MRKGPVIADAPVIVDCAQGTPEWYEARRGIPTASEFHSVIAKGAGKVRRSYMLRLAGEILTGYVEEAFSNAHTERGHQLEAEARDLVVFDVPDLHQVGFIKRYIPDVGWIGCSPDSLSGATGMLEIKTKLPHLQLEVLAAGKTPPAHIAQCQGAMWVAAREWIEFVSYWPGLPLFRERIYPDPDYRDMLAAEIKAFNQELAEIVSSVSKLPCTPKSTRLQTNTITFKNLDGE